MMLFYGVKIHSPIVLLPLILFIQVTLTTGLAFFLSVGHLYYRDIGYIVRGVTPLLMFLTSVLYPIKVSSPQLQGVLTTLNPMTPLIDTYREIILAGRWPNLAVLAVPSCLCFSLFIVGLIWFSSMEHLFAENM